MSEKTRSIEEAKVRRLSLAAAVVALGASVEVQATDISGFPIRQPAPVEGQATVAAPVIRQEKQQALQPATAAPGTGATQMKLDGLPSRRSWRPGGADSGLPFRLNAWVRGERGRGRLGPHSL